MKALGLNGCFSHLTEMDSTLTSFRCDEFFYEHAGNPWNSNLSVSRFLQTNEKRLTAGWVSCLDTCRFLNYRQSTSQKRLQYEFSEQFQARLSNMSLNWLPVSVLLQAAPDLWQICAVCIRDFTVASQPHVCLKTWSNHHHHRLTLMPGNTF